MTNIEFQRGAIDAGSCVGNAWELIKRRYWMYVGIAALGFIMSSYLYCISWFLLGPVLAGIYFVALRDMRGEPVDFGMMFKGFEKFVPLMIIGLLQSIPQVITQILSLTLNIGQLLIPKGRNGDIQFFQRSDPNFAIAGGFFAIIMIVFLAIFLFSILWYLVFLFAVPLVMEYDLAPMDAIKLSAKAGFANVGGLIVLAIFLGLIMLLGFIMICFGIFFVSLPIMYVANAFAYRQVFPWIEQNYNLNPPPPTTYGDFGSGMQ